MDINEKNCGVHHRLFFSGVFFLLNLPRHSVPLDVPEKLSSFAQWDAPYVCTLGSLRWPRTSFESDEVHVGIVRSGSVTATYDQ